MPDPMEHLVEAVAALLTAHELQVTPEQSASGYTTWLHRRGSIRRHLWIRPLEGEFIGQFRVVFGEYPAWEAHPQGIPDFYGFDARTYGTPEFVLDFFRRWVIDRLDRDRVREG